MNITDRAMAQQIIGSFTDSGAKAPKSFADAHGRATRIAAAARNLGAGQGDLAQAVMAALDAGRDPAADPDVQRIAIAAQIANPGIEQQIDALAFDGFHEACAVHTDAIIAAWRKPFDAAAAVLADAHQRLGNLTLEDTASIIAKGADAAEVWAKATAAVKTIEAIRHGWLGLVGITRAAPEDRNYTVLRIAAVDYPTWTAQQLHGRKVGAWDAVLAGLALALPTPAEYRQRVAVIVAGHAADAHQDERARNAALTNRRLADVNP